MPTFVGPEGRILGMGLQHDDHAAVLPVLAPMPGPIWKMGPLIDPVAQTLG